MAETQNIPSVDFFLICRNFAFATILMDDEDDAFGQIGGHWVLFLPSASHPGICMHCAAQFVLGFFIIHAACILFDKFESAQGRNTG